MTHLLPPPSPILPHPTPSLVNPERPTLTLNRMSALHQAEETITLTPLNLNRPLTTTLRTVKSRVTHKGDTVEPLLPMVLERVEISGQS